MLSASESPTEFTKSFTLDSDLAVATESFSDPLMDPMASAMASATGSAMAVARFVCEDCEYPSVLQADESAVAIAWGDSNTNLRQDKVAHHKHTYP